MNPLKAIWERYCRKVKSLPDPPDPPKYDRTEAVRQQIEREIEQRKKVRRFEWDTTGLQDFDEVGITGLPSTINADASGSERSIRG
jgi:hypothetical protein